MEALQKKYEALLETLRQYERLAVAYSGGVDSTFLLKAAQQALGENVLAITARSAVFPTWEYLETEAFCREHQMQQHIVTVDLTQTEAFLQNPPNRCYLCKKTLFTQMLAAAEKAGYPVLAEGSNLDDLGDYRPGLQAIAELKIQSPLRACGLHKAEIRLLSKALHLPTWEKPSFACLASRFVYGEAITSEKLSMVEQAERYLHETGFSQYRVRLHGSMARIELLPSEMGKLWENARQQELVSYFQGLGFSYVTLDLQGYRTGSMNEGLTAGQKEAGLQGKADKTAEKKEV